MTSLGKNTYNILDNYMMAFCLQNKNSRLNFECVFGTFNFTDLVSLLAYLGRLCEGSFTPLKICDCFRSHVLMCYEPPLICILKAGK